MSLRDMAALFDATPPNEIAFVGASIDSRQIKPGDLFVAIRGERFDGHDFIVDAVAEGASVVLCEQAIPGLAAEQWVVKDTVSALGKLATAYRQSCSCRVIALTGSNGKTTVKEMIASILPQPAHATPGNLNNHLGVPLSILQLKPAHRYAVFELGANHPGEIAHTVTMVQPDVTLINNIAPAHIEGFGSIDGVARAKGEIHQGLSAEGTAVINADDAYARAWDAILEDKKIIRFSVEHPVDVHARDVTFDEEGRGHFRLITPTGEALVTLAVPGLHTVRNALAAASCTYALGIELPDIVRGLMQFKGVTGRMTFLTGKNGSVIIDDTYNANLRSSLTALEVLAARRGRRIFIFGDMGELGVWSDAHHQEVGKVARELGIDVLMTCGKQSELTAQAYGTSAKHYDVQQALVEDLLPYLDEQTTVLVKGSRSSGMEHIVQQLVR